MAKNQLFTLLLTLAISTAHLLCAPTSQDESDTPLAKIQSNSTSELTTPSSGTSVTLKPLNKKPRGTTQESSEITTQGELFDFTSYKNTSTFTCDGKVTGYYADVKLNCRVYHFCTQLDGLDGPSYQRMSYMCLENSYFDQKDLNCVRQADLKVTCDKAEAEYERSNKQFDSKEESPPSMSDNLAANIMMNPIARFIAGR